MFHRPILTSNENRITCLTLPSASIEISFLSFGVLIDNLIFDELSVTIAAVVVIVSVGVAVVSDIVGTEASDTDGGLAAAPDTDTDSAVPVGFSLLIAVVSISICSVLLSLIFLNFKYEYNHYK